MGARRRPICGPEGGGARTSQRETKGAPRVASGGHRFGRSLFLSSIKIYGGDK